MPKTALKIAALLAAAVLLPGCGRSTPGSGYARPELLMEPAVLAKAALGGQFVVLDARARKDFLQSRVPGARWVDAAEWAKAFGAGRETAAWSGRIGGLGIGRASKVVVYDSGSVKDAARIWWILRYWGVEDARLLNGGWKGWQAAGLGVETGKPQAVAATTFQAVPHASRLAVKKQLLAALGSGSLQIVDARSEGEFCGTDRQTNKHAGAIPGAKHLEWLDLIDRKTRRFKTAEELRPLFRGAGIELQRPTAAHCQSGGRAAVMVFAMELMGAGDVSSYYAGWGEWGNADDTPIVVAPPKKKEPSPTAPKSTAH
ncbi:MAG: sulfurtransferase [Thermoguttaceae bacterium]